MKRLLLALTTIALLNSTFASAQTPEAAADQTSIDGSGLPLLQTSDTGELSVTNTGSSVDGNYIQFVVHNSSQEIVSDIMVKVEIRDASGALVATNTADGRNIRPQTVSPGEYAIGTSYISGSLPPGFQMTAFVIDFETGVYPNHTIIEFGELNMFGDRIAGEFTNATGDDLEEIYLVGVCFDSAGNLIAGDYQRVEEPMPDGETITFSLDVDTWGDSPCDTFIVAG